MKGKKENNPLKMVGSWIGFIIGILLSLTLLRGYSIFLRLPRIFACNVGLEGGCWASSIYSNLIYVPLCGFLIGWGINILYNYLTLSKRGG